MVVSNICNSPENIAFRHIPRDNAHFHSDLGQYAGGHQCLFALGFKEMEPEEGVVVFTLEVGMLLLSSICVDIINDYLISCVFRMWKISDVLSYRNQTCRWTWTPGAIGLTT